MTEEQKNFGTSAERNNSEMTAELFQESVPEDPSAAAEQTFEERLKQARILYQNSNFDGAFKILRALEPRYMAASSLFGLLGDVLVKKGALEQGLHYKQLHERLDQMLQIGHGISERKLEDKHEPSVETSFAPEFPEEAEFDSDIPYAPATAAMAQELIRQGHYEKASRILNFLLEQNPGDESLKPISYELAKKRGETRVLRTLGDWLNNIIYIKSNRSIIE